MSILFADGFDCYADSTQWVEAHWTRGANNPVLDVDEGRFGGGCIKGTATGQARIGTFVASGSRVIIGFSFKHNGGTSTPNNLVRGAFISGAGSLFSVTYTNGGDLKAHNTSGTQVGSTATGALPADTWVWVEIKVLLGTNDSNGAIDVNVDGVNVISVSGIDTKQGTGVGSPQPLVSLLFGGQNTSGSTHWIDDVIIMDDQGAAPTDFIGPTRIDTMVVTSAGGVNNWTANTGTQAAAVDDTPNATDDDTTYVASSTAAQETRFGIDNLVVEPDDIHAVQLRLRAKKTDAGPRTVRGLINVAGTEALGATMGLPTNYAWMRAGIFRNNPDTSAPFDATEFNSMQAGVEVVA